MARMQPSPSWTSCATWLFAISRHPFATRVTPPPPAVPMCTVANSRIRFPFPITRRVCSPAYLRSWGMAPMAANWKIALSCPMVVSPSITA